MGDRLASPPVERAGGEKIAATRKSVSWSAWLTVSALVLLSGCEGAQSALQPGGPAARETAYLWWGMFWAGAVVFAIVLVPLLLAVFREPQRRWEIDPMRMVIAGGVVLPVVALSALLPFGLNVASGVSQKLPEDAITIRVKAHQWWWDVEYSEQHQPSRSFTTANEIRLPVGRPVELILTSADVVHSLWIPRLAGKMDLIPGHSNRLVVEADEEGIFRGQCAEFCGIAHAKMAFQVAAMSPSGFEEWAARQRSPAPPPATEPARRGAAAFQKNGCALCHAVRGHGAWSREGPDLTHLGSRKTIGAGLLATNAENIALWIARNEELKPGNRMPDFTHLDPETRLAIGAYLESLE